MSNFYSLKDCSYSAGLEKVLSERITTGAIVKTVIFLNGNGVCITVFEPSENAYYQFIFDFSYPIWSFVEMKRL